MAYPVPSFNAFADLGSANPAQTLTAAYNYAGTELLVWTTTNDTVSPASITYNGVSLAGPYAFDAEWNSWCFLLSGNSAGSKNIVITTVNPNVYIAGVAADWSGVSTAGQPDKTQRDVDSISENVYSSNFSASSSGVFVIAVAKSSGGSDVPTTSGIFVKRGSSTDNGLLVADTNSLVSAQVTLTASIDATSPDLQAHQVISLFPSGHLYPVSVSHNQSAKALKKIAPRKSLTSSQATRTTRSRPRTNAIGSGQSISRTTTVLSHRLVLFNESVIVARSISHLVTFSTSWIVSLTKMTAKSVLLATTQIISVIETKVSAGPTLKSISVSFGESLSLARLSSLSTAISVSWGESVFLRRMASRGISIFFPESVRLTEQKSLSQAILVVFGQSVQIIKTPGRAIATQLNHVISVIGRLSLSEAISVSWNEAVSLRRLISRAIAVSTAESVRLTEGKALSHAIGIAIGQSVLLTRLPEKMISLATNQSIRLFRTTLKTISFSISQIVARTSTRFVSISESLSQFVSFTHGTAGIINLVTVQLTSAQAIITSRFPHKSLSVRAPQRVAVFRRTAKALAVTISQSLSATKTWLRNYAVNTGQSVLLKTTKAYPSAINISQGQTVSVSRFPKKLISVVSRMALSLVKRTQPSISLHTSQSVRLVTLGHITLKRLDLALAQAAAILTARGPSIFIRIASALRLVPTFVPSQVPLYASLEMTAPQYVLDLASVLPARVTLATIKSATPLSGLFAAIPILQSFAGIEVISFGIANSPSTGGSGLAISGEVQASRIPSIVRFVCVGNTGVSITIDAIYMGKAKFVYFPTPLT